MQKVWHERNLLFPVLVYVSSFIPPCAVNINHLMVLVLTNWTKLYCVIHKGKTINNPLLQTRLLMGSSQLQNESKEYRSQRSLSLAQHPAWLVHTLRGPWHNKYLYGCYTFQCQDLTCSDGMKLLQCISRFHRLLSSEKWTISDP